MLKIFGKFGFKPTTRRDPQIVHLALRLADGQERSAV
jgi:hypothetical protein